MGRKGGSFFMEVEEFSLNNFKYNYKGFSRKVNVGETFKLHDFSWCLFPTVEGYDNEFVELKTLSKWSNPTFKALKTGKTSIELLVYFWLTFDYKCIYKKMWVRYNVEIT
jgi:hypothetical protein